MENSLKLKSLTHIIESPSSQEEKAVKIQSLLNLPTKERALMMLRRIDLQTDSIRSYQLNIFGMYDVQETKQKAIAYVLSHENN